MAAFGPSRGAAAPPAVTNGPISLGLHPTDVPMVIHRVLSRINAPKCQFALSIREWGNIP